MIFDAILNAASNSALRSANTGSTATSNTSETLISVWRLTIRLSDARLRRQQSKLIYPNHRLPPWPTEAATRERSNRLLDVIATSTKVSSGAQMRVENALSLRIVKCQSVLFCEFLQQATNIVGSGPNATDNQMAGRSIENIAP